MKKQRWLSLVLILALVVGLCSVCAAAADDQTAEQPAQEAADTVAEAEAAPADGTQPDAAAAEANTETAEQPEQDAAAETDAAAEEAPADGTHIHAVNREDACEEPAFEPLTVRGGQLESGCYYLTEDWTLDEPLCVAKNGVQVTLCLNGYSLSLADGAEGCIIYLAVSDEGAEPSVLTITDCNGAGTSSNYYGRKPISRRTRKTRSRAAASPARRPEPSAWATITSCICPASISSTTRAGTARALSSQRTRRP